MYERVEGNVMSRKVCLRHWYCVYGMDQLHSEYDKVTFYVYALNALCVCLCLCVCARVDDDRLQARTIIYDV